MGIIYQLSFPETDKVYVGQTTYALEKRVWEHKCVARKGRDWPLCKAIRKHGEDSVEVSVLEECPDDQLDDREIYWIKKLGSLCPNGYNAKEGGSNGLHSEEAKRKMSRIAMGKPGTMTGRKHSEETKRKMSATHKGRTVSPETRRKISQTLTGRPGKKHTAESKRKLREANLGKRHTEESKRKMSAAHTGKTLSPAHRQALKEAWVRRKNG